MGGACGTYGGEKRCIQGLVGNPDGKRPFGTPKRRWEHIKIYLQEVGYGEAWIGLIRLRTETHGKLFVNMVMNFRLL